MKKKLRNPCVECYAQNQCGNGLCLDCCMKALRLEPMRSARGQHLAASYARSKGVKIIKPETTRAMAQLSLF